MMTADWHTFERRDDYQSLFFFIVHFVLAETSHVAFLNINRYAIGNLIFLRKSDTL